MKRSTLLCVCLLALFLIIAGCTKAECKQDTQCIKEYHTGSCVDKKCAYQKAPAYWCGDTLCTGKYGLYLQKFCADDKTTCTSTLPSEKITPTSLVNELTFAGDKFKLTTDFNQPFNTRKDFFTPKITLEQPAQINSEHAINRIELTGLTKDKRTVTLAEKEINRPLWGEGSDVSMPLIITAPTQAPDGELTNLILKIYYSYIQTAGGQKQTKNDVLQNNYAAQKLIWVQPEKPYPCPAKCDDKGLGMTGSCNPTTGFCDYTPTPNQCGNTICEPNENKCTCAQDCGPCTGTVGAYSIKTCSPDNRCITAAKQGITPTPQTIFDDRPLGGFHLQNNYKYTNPFNTKTDKFSIDLTLYELQPQATHIKIEAIRLLDGPQQIAEQQINKDLPTVSSTIHEDITIPPQAQPELDRNIIVAVWYQYTQSGITQKANFQKPLNKITLLSPE